MVDSPGRWKLEMVRTYRNEVGCSQKEAFDALEAALKRHEAPQMSAPQSRRQRHADVDTPDWIRS